MLDGSHVRRAAGVCASFLTSAIDDDWARPVPEMDWNVAKTVAHAAEGCLWYAIDLAAAGAELDEAVKHEVLATARPSQLLGTMVAYAEVVASTIDCADPATLGFHPVGPADPSGFAGMACDELLIHTDDAARGLSRSFEVPADLAEAVLGRLFPWVESEDPWKALLWANGRIAFDDRPRLSRWVWHCKPLADWNGETPSQIE